MFLLYGEGDEKQPLVTGPMMYKASNDESMFVAAISKDLGQYIEKRFALKLSLVETSALSGEIIQLLSQQRVLLLKSESDVELMLEDRSTFPFEDYAIRYVPGTSA
jgi:hypothetical protein